MLTRDRFGSSSLLDLLSVCCCLDDVLHASAAHRHHRPVLLYGPAPPPASREPSSTGLLSDGSTIHLVTSESASGLASQSTAYASRVRSITCLLRSGSSGSAPASQILEHQFTYAPWIRPQESARYAERVRQFPSLGVSSAAAIIWTRQVQSRLSEYGSIGCCHHQALRG